MAVSVAETRVATVEGGRGSAAVGTTGCAGEGVGVEFSVPPDTMGAVGKFTMVGGKVGGSAVGGAGVDDSGADDSGVDDVVGISNAPRITANNNSVVNATSA